MYRELRSGLGMRFLTLASLGAALVALRFFPVSKMSLEAYLGSMVLMAWLSYQFLEPFHLLRRRALLSEVYVRYSGIRDFFWKCTIGRIGLALASIGIAALALMTADAMENYEWAILLSSVPVFWLVLVRVNSRIGPHLKDRYQLRFGMCFANVITVALLVCALVAWQIYVVEVPRTTHLAWHEVLSQAYAEKSAATSTPRVGWILGVNAAISDLAWHVMQVARVAGESDLWAYIAGCALLLGWSAAKLGSIWLVLLGVIVVTARSRQPSTDEDRQLVSSVPFFAAVAAVAVLVVVLQKVDFSDTWNASTGTRGTVLETSRWPTPDPCEGLRFHERRAVSSAVALEASAQQRELDARILRLVDERVDAVFLRAERGVDSFLDWNFSVEGQYHQLAYLTASAVGSDSFAGYIALRVDEYVHSHLEAGLGKLGEEMHGELSGAIESVFIYQEALATHLLQEASCLKIPKPTMSPHEYMRKSMVGLGAVSGTVGTLAVNRLGVRMVSRVAMKRAISAVAAKGATRTASAVKGGLAGLACGPFAPVCVVGFAAAAWVATDVAINAIDEAMHRDEMRAEMIRVLEGEKESLRLQLQASYLGVSAQLFQDVQEYQAAKFNIHRDGGFGAGS